MAKEKLLIDFKDIIKPRKYNNDFSYFTSRYWDPQPAYRVSKKISPNDLKILSLKSKELNKILDHLSVSLKRDRNELQKEVIQVLNEIGLDRKMYSIQWFNHFIINGLSAMHDNVFVNERNIFHLKSIMGKNPVIFIVSHKSFVDVILLIYICYAYDIEMPATAAGENISYLFGLSKMFRNSGVFYIRRSFIGDKLYSATFKQYIKTMVTNYHSPINFFIEGMRSRSGKCLVPKYGLTAIIMECLFDRSVTDLTFVPVSVSYDRILEETMFPYELLGVPKNPESTWRLFNSLHMIHENYGNLYINIGKPISAVEYLGSCFEKSQEIRKSSKIQNISKFEFGLVRKMTHGVMNQVQTGMIIPTFPLVSVSIMVSFHNERAMNVGELEEHVIWLSSIVKTFGGLAFDYDKEIFKKEFDWIVKMHKSTMMIDKNSNVRLYGSAPYQLASDVKKKMKGHRLSEKTMEDVLPVITNQIYINSVLPCMISGIIIYKTIDRSPTTKDVLQKQYQKWRSLFEADFPVNEATIFNEFESSLSNLIDLNALKFEADAIVLGSNRRVHELFDLLFWPYFNCAQRLGEILLKENNFDETHIFKTVQQKFESDLSNKQDIHPYCLSLECIQNSIQGYKALNALKIQRKNNSVVYDINSEEVSNIVRWLSSFPQRVSKFNSNNPVIIQKRGILSRL